MRGRAVGARLAILLGGTVAIAAGGVAGGAAKHPLRCATSGHTIASNKHIRVFRVGPPDQYSAYACVMPRGRARHLGDYEGDDGGLSWEGVYWFKLSGDFVAYEDAFCDHSGGCGGGSLKSFNVVSRQMAHRARIPGGETQYFVLVLNRRGSIAWTRGAVMGGAPTLWKCDAPKCMLLDRGHPGRRDYVDLSSLKLNRHTLSWSHGDGTTHVARLE